MNIPTASSILRQLEKIKRLATHPDPQVRKAAIQKLEAVASGIYVTVAGEAAVEKAKAILAALT